tara:strand:- start:4027 stop:4983 length:957 start_codon:yes stop_codon:yes gene_type:complete
MKEKKTILVTGGAGFIGSALTKRLVEHGNDVVVIDNFNQYYDPELKRKRQEVFLGDAVVVEGDITDQICLEELFTEYEFDAVAHLAAQAGVRYSVEVPESYVAANVLGTQILLEAMRKHEVKQLVYASTSSVYGINTPLPFLETASADKPVSVYAATKRAGELLAHSYYQQYDIHATCLRFFTVYGPWSRPDMAMLKFAEKIQQGRAIDVYNHGNLRRDFTYIDDIVNGFIGALSKSLGYEIINLGNGTPVELMHFIELLEKYLGKTAKKNMIDMQQGDVFETYADITKAKELLGYKPQIGFDEGTQVFVDWFKSYFR